MVSLALVVSSLAVDTSAYLKVFHFVSSSISRAANLFLTPTAYSCFTSMLFDMVAHA